ncbi:MAG: NAD(P)H-dependent glycerol-3-phosphate dehydrogenase [candidate division KSB1 bacterium]|nr:NAD(P)H-dependent glycerol-3-phosphate dehydrogenase [candidate division KSB1 bacterium]MDZ7275491.1 NAD(P)H-dependent glycerol-3-phosphate dehydrogenase [candidate division KSB1 bacterium]MDZ7286197.1 NAD(P)H-dependent glycerol-3-phosphate dehydrogenase [candidate division KSB1 bacterium]MDZ7296423.1 NAD(P)H-dependent glycerol-3-phosphate dehydrogenase [candidate division KSB1 bacterium]MDZ7308953.1 NAD(P)H-dependent glycerol-3-phosphate dehydrogenase [candidate division KSB1 bacterium]
MAKVGVIGAGSWGTALAKRLCDNGHVVRLWCRRPALAQQINAQHSNPAYLPGLPLPESLRATADLADAVAGAHVVLIATPSHTLREVVPRLPVLPADTILISAVKGLEPQTDLRMSQVIAASLPRQHAIVALSGPSLAEEVARDLPTAVVAAAENLEVARTVQALLMGPCFRVYTHHDIIGVELGGALKNIIALAAGIGDGAGFGDNTKAALITRGLVEMTRVGACFGAEPITFAGLSGMGDLVVTCMSKKSRNRAVGEAVGRGQPLQAVLANMNMVAEGVRTTQAMHAFALKQNLDLPITREVYQVLFKAKNARQAVNDLMTREAKMERFA